MKAEQLKTGALYFEKCTADYHSTLLMTFAMFLRHLEPCVSGFYTAITPMWLSVANPELEIQFNAGIRYCFSLSTKISERMLPYFLHVILGT